MSWDDRLDRLAQWAAAQIGRARGFGVALAIVGVWVVSGLACGWSGTWALLAGTGTSLVTFVLVYLLVHALNRDNEGLQQKLDALLWAQELSQNRLRRFDGLT